jgi:hypothetical protein
MTAKGTGAWVVSEEWAQATITAFRMSKIIKKRLFSM